MRERYHGKEEREIDAILTTVGLMDCADTKVGNQFLKGLSGGQKRRLSLAVSLLTDPKVCSWTNRLLVELWP